MSRVGKKNIAIPAGVEVKVVDQKVSCRGPKGELGITLPAGVKVTVDQGVVTVVVASDREMDKAVKSSWGTARSLISNLIIGVTTGFSKKLEIQGVGYSAQVNGKKIVLKMGFSHPVEILAPTGVEFKLEKNIITISGADKNLVGQTAALIREVRKPEPYKGKGIRYIDEYVRKKAGKKAVASEGAGA